MRETKFEKQWHWHFLHISIGNMILSHRKYLPICDIRKDSFDLLWRGFYNYISFYHIARSKGDV